MSLSQVFKLLTDLKEQRKDAGKSKHSLGQQDLNTIMYEVGTIHTVWALVVKSSPCAHLHLLSDTKVFVKDAMQQTESWNCQRVPHHHDASEADQVSI